MKNNKYKILVLSDLSDKSPQALSYAAKLSNEIDANIEFFHVKAATELTHTENPLSAIRIMSEVCSKTEKKVKNLVTPISNENNIKIKTTFAFGNVKNEIENCIKISQPDMIILGERKQKRFHLFGDNITNFVHKKYDGVVIIATDKNVLDTNGKVSLDNLGLKNNIANYNIKAKDKTIA
jgi:nucleotide-binding universal stress UspA family protein